MRLSNFKKFLTALFILCPLASQAEVITIDEVTVQVQPEPGNTFKLFFKFEVPQLPEKVNIDYAVLSFGVNITNLSTKVLELLSATKTTVGKSADYNTNPVTAVISKGKSGLNQIDVDITQLVNLWVNGGDKNEGITLISHRNIEEKGLESSKMALAPEFKKASVRIFYTSAE